MRAIEKTRGRGVSLKSAFEYVAVLAVTRRPAKERDRDMCVLFICIYETRKLRSEKPYGFKVNGVGNNL